VASDSRAHIQKFFAILRAGGRNVNTALPWGFSFTAEHRSRLESLAKYMAAEGYQVEEEILNQHERSPLLVLWVERIEVHSVESLHIRTIELAELARQYGVDLDSWGAGRGAFGSRFTKRWWEFWK